MSSSCAGDGTGNVDAVPSDGGGGGDDGAGELRAGRGRAAEGGVQRVQRRHPGDIAGGDRRRRRGTEGGDMPADRGGVRGLGDIPGGRPRRRRRPRRPHDRPRQGLLRAAAGRQAPLRHVRRQEGRIHRLQPSSGTKILPFSF